MADGDRGHGHPGRQAEDDRRRPHRQVPVARRARCGSSPTSASTGTRSSSPRTPRAPAVGSTELRAGARRPALPRLLDAGHPPASASSPSASTTRPAAAVVDVEPDARPLHPLRRRARRCSPRSTTGWWSWARATSCACASTPRALPPLPAGWRRDFLLFVDGWAKDGDANTAFSQTRRAAAVPRHVRYPYPAGERFPDDPAHRLWRSATRRARRCGCCGRWARRSRRARTSRSSTPATARSRWCPAPSSGKATSRWTIGRVEERLEPMRRPTPTSRSCPLVFRPSGGRCTRRGRCRRRPRLRGGAGGRTPGC